MHNGTSPLPLPLHPRQTVAFASPATEILFGGAAGGGKSHLLRAAALTWCLLVPGLQVYLFRRTRSSLYRNHMTGPQGFPALLSTLNEAARAREDSAISSDDRAIDSGGDNAIASINFSDHRIHFFNHSTIFLCHCQLPEDIYKYQGAEMHVLLIDELTHFSDSMYRFLRGRVRLAGLTLPAPYAGRFPRVLCGSNPGGGGHNWVKAAFLHGASAGHIRRMPASEGGLLRQYIPSLLSDNPSLALSDPGYASRLEGLGSPALVRAMRFGDWNITAGGAFDDLWSPNFHVLPRFAIPDSWRLDRSFDWGGSKPFSVGWWAESDGTECEINGATRHFPRGTLIRVHELYGWNGTPDQGLRLPPREVAEAILDEERRAFPGRRVHPGPADSSIYASGEGESIATAMERAGVRWTRANKRSGSRKQGFEAFRGRLKASLSIPPEEPSLYVTENCTHFIRTIPSLRRSSADPDDVDTRAEDHIYDETRYRILRNKHFVKTD